MTQPERAPDPAVRALPDRLAMAFLPLDKRAFGAALGTACGAAVAGATALLLIQGRENDFNLWLLNQYFFGYTVTWPGALVGFAWAFVVGFTAGWFMALCRNFVLALSVFLVRTRAELFETRDFLDHI
jgi:hypothetical protein